MRFTQEGWKLVRDRVGQGKIVGKLRVNQVYAKYQHERMDLSHPRGGGPKYLERPLLQNAGHYLQRIANEIPDGDPVAGMIDAMENLNDAMAAAAPVLFDNLRRSGNPKVYDRGALVYNRPPQQPRLSKRQLRALRRGRRRR
jgi:hypothetical protein